LELQTQPHVVDVFSWCDGCNLDSILLQGSGTKTHR
jgi:hypothetical protein